MHGARVIPTAQISVWLLHRDAATSVSECYGRRGGGGEEEEKKKGTFGSSKLWGRTGFFFSSTLLLYTPIYSILYGGDGGGKFYKGVGKSSINHRPKKGFIFLFCSNSAD